MTSTTSGCTRSYFVVRRVRDDGVVDDRTGAFAEVHVTRDEAVARRSPSTPERPPPRAAAPHPVNRARGAPGTILMVARAATLTVLEPLAVARFRIRVARLALPATARTV